MIKIENYEVMGWEHVIRGMRNPMNSWDKSDSKKVTAVLKTRQVHPGIEETYYAPCEPYYSVGPEDYKLMKKLAKAGSDHRKFMRMIVVYLDITAPLYWWKEFDTYKVGTVANSCSTMHKIHAKEFEMEDFSTDQLFRTVFTKHKPLEVLQNTIDDLNYWREAYIKTKNNDIDAPIWMVEGREATAHDIWYNMIQLLPSSYNQKRTILLNYEVLANMYRARRNHKLDEWHTLCDWIESLPYSELITGAAVNVDEGNGTGEKNEEQ